MTTYTWQDVGENPSRTLTQSEKETIANQWNAWEAKSAERKLQRIREIRLEKLQETDYLANSDMTMPDNIATWKPYSTSSGFSAIWRERFNARNDGYRHQPWFKRQYS